MEWQMVARFTLLCWLRFPPYPTADEAIGRRCVDRWISWHLFDKCYAQRRGMSHQVNLSSKEIANAYQDVINGELDWAIFTYEGGTNDLKVQSTGGGGLEDLEEEFSDGRCVFNAIRFDDPSQNLLIVPSGFSMPSQGS